MDGSNAPVRPVMNPSTQLPGEKVFRVMADCVIKHGDVCTIHYPTHHDAKSYAFHRTCDRQKARVVAIHEHGVDIEILSGSAKWKTIRDINPEILYFAGPFMKK